jgi:hypothetical protein
MNPYLKPSTIFLALLISSLAVNSISAQPFYVQINGPSTYCIPGQTSMSVTPAGGVSFRWFAYPAYPWGLPYTTSPVFYSPPTGMWICEVTTSSGVYATNVVMIQTTDPYITSPGGTAACTPSTVLLQDNASSVYAMSMYNTYQWRRDGVNIPGANGYTYQASTSGVYTLQISIGCGSAVSNPIAVTISSPIPSSTTITVSGPTTFCQGGSVNLSVPAIANSYQWKRNGINISGAASNSYNASIGGSYTCTLSSNCGSHTTAAVTVTVNPIPSVSITPGGPTTFCQGNSVLLSATTGAGYSYQWYRDGSSISGAVSANYSANQSGSYHVSVSAGGCTGTSSAIMVTVNPLPLVSFSGLSTSYICQSPAVTLTGNPAGGSFSGPGIIGNQFNPSALPIGGPYSITYSYSDMNGCTNSVSGTTSVISGYNCLTPQNLTVNSLASTSVSFSWNYSSANSFQVRYRKVGAATYTIKTFAATACQNNYTLTGLKKNTNYEMSVRSNCSSGASAYSNTVTFKTPAARLAGTEQEFRIYPNPVSDWLNFELYSEKPVKGEIKIVDMIGRIVFQSTPEWNDQGTYKVNLDHLPDGIYIMQIQFDDESYTRRIVKSIR